MLKINPTFRCYILTENVYNVIGSQLKIIAQSTVDIFYPNQCEICSVDLHLNESHICLNCKYDLPYLNDSLKGNEGLQKLFWGRVDVEKVHALFNYQKGTQVQDLLKQIKYHHKKKLGKYLGFLLGDQLPDDEIDLIVPVPLHPKKQRSRGYNQSELIANGIRSIRNIPVEKNALKRIKHNPTQTSISKFDRWENVRDIFAVNNPKKLRNKHILIVDDVLTTGATIEACVRELLSIEGCKVSVATIAARV